MESVVHFRWAAGLLLKCSAILLCHGWGNAGLITLPIRARMSMETSTADRKEKDQGRRVCGPVAFHILKSREANPSVSRWPITMVLD